MNDDTPVCCMDHADIDKLNDDTPVCCMDHADIVLEWSYWHVAWSMLKWLIYDANSVLHGMC